MGRLGSRSPLIVVLVVLGCSATKAPPSNSEILLFGNDAGCPAGGAPSQDAGAPSQDAGSPCTPSLPSVSFARDVAPIFGACSGELCHKWSYASLINAPALECCDGRKIVSPGHPNQSYLLQKLLGSSDMCGGSQMPLGGAPVDAHSVAVLSSWICLGAPNN